MIKIQEDYYSKYSDVRRLLEYISGKGSNKETEQIYGIISKGLSKDPKKAADQVLRMQEAANRRGRRRLYHMILSFKEVSDKNLLRICQNAIADMIFQDEGFQVYSSIHTSTANKHIHMAINAVSYQTCRKWHKSKAELNEFKKKITDLIEEVICSYR